MCPGSGGSDTESRGVIICDDLISKNGGGGGGDYKNEDTMRVRGEVKFVHGLLRRLGVNGNAESLNDISEIELGDILVSNKVASLLLLLLLLLIEIGVKKG
ncbi:hypothetical protein NC651_035947 [Populus alba x Populus x berolinensis]|nr:hypothetical protein NC651_035947 [Populus alba x Populus x berolinensis]